MTFSGWEEVKLGDVCESISVTHKFNKTNLIFLNTSDILDGKILHKKYSLVSNMPGQAKKSIRRGDILYSEIRPKNKRYALVDIQDSCDYVVSTKLMVIRNKQNINNKYLYLLLTSNELLDTLQQVAESRSGTFPQITFSQVSELITKLPPLTEQKAIANILSVLDDKIDLNNRINKTLEKMAQAIFKSWFVNFEQFQDGEFEDSELGRIPKGWKVDSIGNINIIVSDFVANGSFASLKENVTLYGESNYAHFIRNTDLKADKFEKFVDERSYKFLSKTKLYGNEVIISNVGDVGSVFLCPMLPKLMTLGNNMIMITSKKNDEYNMFLYILFKYSYGKDLIKSITGGSAQPKFNKTDFRSLKIILPCEEILCAFNTLVESLFRELNTKNKEKVALISIRDNLLPKLMSGEISVPIEEDK